MRLHYAAAMAVLGVMIGCGAGEKAAKQEKQDVEKQAYGQTRNGIAVDLYMLRNKNGMEVGITNYGGIIVSLKTPDRNGALADIVLGFDSLDGYLGGHPYFGAIIGRYGNRIAKGKFTLGGKQYQLALNNGPNALHGGLEGFDKKVWRAEPFERQTERGLILHYTSPDGEEGYPGTLTTTVTYTLTDANELRIDYQASTDKDTVVNLTNHSYFNLAGAGNGDILGHRMMIHADRFTPVDDTLIPTGELKSVEGTPFDFRKPTPIGARINVADQQIAYGGGYDHNYVLNRSGEGLSLAARVTEPNSGRTMEVSTTEPGVQFYTGNFLDGTITGKGGKVYQKRAGFCLETQHYPDSPNQKAFPSVVVRPGVEYRSSTVYKFGVE